MSGFCSRHKDYDPSCHICVSSRRLKEQMTDEWANDSKEVGKLLGVQTNILKELQLVLTQKAIDMDYCYTCKCNSIKFHILRSFQIECAVCGKLMELPFDITVMEE